jgi:hypothetical protein
MNGHASVNRVRYHVALVPIQAHDLEAELNHYAERGWRVVAVDGNRVVFEETVPRDD